MKGNRMYVDIGSMLDEIFDAAKQFGDQFKDFGPNGEAGKSWFNCSTFDDNSDCYPNFSYPPMNIYLTQDRSMVFEFALAGFEEKNINLSFQGDYMVFSAAIDPASIKDEGIKYFKRRLKMKDIDKQKYYVPAEKFDQEAVKAKFKNGILQITVPPKDIADQNDGVKIEIVTED